MLDGGERFTEKFKAYFENIYKNDSHKIIILSDGPHENMVIIQLVLDGHKPKILLLELDYLLGNTTKFSIAKRNSEKNKYITASEVSKYIDVELGDLEQDD